ncbi:hypothetical protein GN244_ATG12397 [Phytophthora infestans]|uniref:Uncharacterized protein n=1 Tax=Phytophthora infestans TaxID=4787 RepID=A0A833S7L2_PHYIN|nr:hypothetical protein GN244_ATG12397 [Phytophthora infestans]KAI9982153.1 hypothetical protein PInf_008044 [Phytophthora infestans]
MANLVTGHGLQTRRDLQTQVIVDLRLGPDLVTSATDGTVLGRGQVETIGITMCLVGLLYSANQSIAMTTLDHAGLRGDTET